MNSPQSAKDHYESKAHDRHITTWINKFYADKGTKPLIVKRFVKDGGPVGPNAFHCELCDLKLTSQAHASQHYAGRKHKLVAQNVSRPAGSGYYNNEGKWVRTSTKAEEDKSSRFGIGVKFTEEAQKANISAASSTAADTTTAMDIDEEIPSPKKAKKSDTDVIAINPALHCSVCNISVTSSTQMVMHMEGIKHRKKLTSMGIEPSSTPLPSESEPITAESIANNSVLASALKQDDSNIDVSMYRTPSGQFYCKTCNMNMQHSAALLQHLSGKKHLRKVADEKAALSLQKKQI